MGLLRLLFAVDGRTNRKALCLYLLVASLFIGGCTTTKKWNSYIDDKLMPRPQADSFQKGMYVGIIQENKDYYHRYLFPNAFDNANKDYFEILIPASRLNKHPLITRALPQSIPHNLTYNALIEYNDPNLSPLNPQYCQIVEIFDQSISEYPYPLNRPFFIKMTIDRIGKKPRIRYGQLERKPRANANNNDFLMSNNHYLACSSIKYSSFYLVPSESLNDDRGKCDIWYWSDVLVSKEAYDDLSKEAGYSTLRYAGYLVTVPIDIVLAPVRGIGFIVGVIVMSNWSGH